MADSAFGLTVPGISRGGSFSKVPVVTIPVVPTVPDPAFGGTLSNVALPAVVGGVSGAVLIYTCVRIFVEWRKAAARARAQLQQAAAIPAAAIPIPFVQVTNPPGTSPAADDFPNDVYQKLEELGAGNFGVVYKGRHRTGNLVAIKEMPVKVAHELKVEFDLLGGLTHPNVITILGFEVGQRHARLFLEWAAGGSLSDTIKKFAVDEVLLRSYTHQILLGLKFLHDHNLLHRDIKPRNILIDHKGQLKLTDFGLSRHIGSIQDKTRMCGTPAYMAPECTLGRFSVASDIWAVGATMSEIMTREVPWSHLHGGIRNDGMALLFHIGREELQGNPNHHPIIPSALTDEARSFMRICFAPNPKDRGTCESLLQHPFLLPHASDHHSVRPDQPSPASLPSDDSLRDTETFEAST